MWTPSLWFWLIGVLFLQLGTPSGANLRDFLQCRLCETVNPEGNISDCSCDFASVNLAVEHFFQPLLRNITRSTFFRYFRVDLERHCPFWQEEGSCIMEGCSVCECDEKEVPRNWIDEQGSAIPRLTMEQMTPESINHAPSTVTEADKLNSKSNSIDHEKDLPRTPASTPDEPTHTHLSGSSILDGDNRLRQQPWRQGQLLQPEQSEDPQMSGLHIANARNEDAAPDSDYDSYFALRAGKTKVSEANITGDDIVCDTSAVDASGKILLKSAHSSACAYDPEIHSWTDMVEDDCLSGTHTGDNPATYATAEMVHTMEDTSPVCAENSAGGLSSPYAIAARRVALKKRGAYVNLVDNPESFTGYAGESAIRVWKAIQEENCFSDGGYSRTASNNANGQCLEKRVFYRLMSGLQASISTHIAKEYFFEESQTWGTNIPLFVRRVGSHRERLNNLYFTFLFVLRAVSKASPHLSAYSYDTGDAAKDAELAALVQQLVHTAQTPAFESAQQILLGAREASVADAPVKEILRKTIEANVPPLEDIQECRTGFDEAQLFQVPTPREGVSYATSLHENTILQETFRSRFRNITRIMDCVTCDKCRVWGKLQILGLGTSIKLLLTSDGDLAQASAAQLEFQNLRRRGVPQARRAPQLLTRQEVIALINTLHQLSVSVLFAAKASEVELHAVLIDVRDRFIYAGTVGLMAVVFFLPLLLFRRYCKRKKVYIEKA